MDDKRIKAFIETFSKELANENAAVFVGAGLSVPAGYVNWRQLLAGVAREIGLDVELEHDLVAIAQYHYNERQNRSALNRVLIEEFSPGHDLTENHRILARLPIKTFWTTNYDTLIEKALEKSGKLPDVKYTTAQLKHSLPKRDAIVYKMHGDIAHPDDAVLTKDDYERYHETRGPFATALSGDLIGKCFLFLGFSFSDPNIDYILSRVRLSLRQPRDHYCILKRIERSDFSDDDAFKYAEVKQELMIGDLKRFGIQALLVDKYTDITGILASIERRHRQHTVFISGSAHLYDPLSQETAQAFITQLTEEILRNSCKIVSGFGLGVGSFVISSALNELYNRQRIRLHDQLILRPFPQGAEAKAQWEKYRQDMIAYAGTAVFVFGNKLDGGVVQLAGGVKREFEIATQLGLSVIPVGSTGYMAEVLWIELMTRFDDIYPYRPDLRNLFQEIGPGKSINKSAAIVLQIINSIKEG